VRGFDVDQGLGGGMLDRLEGSHRHAELHPLADVLHGHVEHAPGQSQGLGGDQQGDDCIGFPRAVAAQAADADALRLLQAHVAEAAGAIDHPAGLDIDARFHVREQPEVQTIAAAQRQQEMAGHGRFQHHRYHTRQAIPGHLHLERPLVGWPASGNAQDSYPLAFEHFAQKLGAARQPRGKTQGPAGTGQQHAAGRDGPPQFLEHQGLLDPAPALAAKLLGNADTHPGITGRECVERRQVRRIDPAPNLA